MENKHVALWLTVFCAAVFVVQNVVVGFTELLVLNQQAFVQPWRFVSAVFLHGDLLHLLYNGFALALFGSILEHHLGSKRFLGVFLITGILANLISVFFYPSALGASGAVFGIIGALVVLRPGMTVFAFGLPMPMILAGIVWAIGDLVGVFVPSNVANLAHLAGMGFGILAGFIYRRPAQRTMKEREIHIDEHALRQWEDRYLR